MTTPESWSKCPVCGTEMKQSRDTMEGTTLESGDDCPNGCYHYYFAYGSEEWCICDREWFGHYTDSAEAWHARRLEIKRWTEECRKKRS